MVVYEQTMDMDQMNVYRDQSSIKISWVKVVTPSYYAIFHKAIGGSLRTNIVIQNLYIFLKPYCVSCVYV